MDSATKPVTVVATYKATVRGQGYYWTHDSAIPSRKRLLRNAFGVGGRDETQFYWFRMPGTPNYFGALKTAFDAMSVQDRADLIKLANAAERN